MSLNLSMDHQIAAIFKASNFNLYPRVDKGKL